MYLLQLPALFGSEHRELAAAGLYRAAEALLEIGDERGSAAVRRELEVSYGRTFHAAKLRDPPGPKDRP